MGVDVRGMALVGWKFFWTTRVNGIPPSPWLPVYKTDLKQNEIQDIPREWRCRGGASAIARTEYIFKDSWALLRGACSAGFDRGKRGLQGGSG